MKTHALPSAEKQLVFLGKLQRIFTESDLTATYKFAPLTALVELAVELGLNDGDELIVSIRQIAERFIQLSRVLSKYQLLLSSVEQTVPVQPLNYLQNFGDLSDAFLYERPGAGRVRLNPGVGYSLRRFQPLVQQQARSHWVAHIKHNRRNAGILGQADDPENFFICRIQALTACD